MKTNTTLFLTEPEAAAFAKLPEGLREGWTVEPETGTAYEDADVLKVRAGMARFDSYPQLKDIANDVLAGKQPNAAAFDGIPESVLPELYFTIGATGIAILVRILLPKVADDEDIAGLAGLTHLRHDILETNASISLA
jgi:hypothetical protein